MAENTGTVKKIGVSIKPMGGIHMEDMEFSCVFYVHPKRSVTLTKSGMIRADADNYIAIVDTGLIGPGDIFCRVECLVPDRDIAGGYRKEVGTFYTGEFTER